MADAFPILYFGNDWFAENRTSSHHVAERLGRKHPLLYIDTPGMRAPQATGRDVKKLFRKLKQAVELPKQVGPHMWVMTMPQIPFHGLPGVKLLNRVFSRMLVKRAARSLGFRKPVYWFVVPHASVALGDDRKNFVVYYCIDDYAAFPGVDTASVQKMDDDLTRRANQLFVAAEKLLPAKITMNRTATLSPHGVDVDLFGSAQDPRLEIPEEAQNLTHPVIGYFGAISNWTDTDLIGFLADSRPDWTFLLIGLPSVDVSSLRVRKNIVLIPPQPYKTLPRWAKVFDAAIIPYRLTQQVLNANPLKLREYLATGKPVISTWTPEVEKFRDVVRIAKDHGEFLKQIETSLHEDCDAAREDRLKAVRGSSWDSRVDDVLTKVKKQMNETGFQGE